MTNNLPFLIVAASLLAVGLVLAAQSGTFNVTLTITNDAPTISYVNNSFSLTPVENATGLYQFYFNVTDTNGAADVNDTSATVVVTLGSQTATSSGCTPTDDVNVVAYNCSIALPYYFNASSSWGINASIRDNSGSYVQNTTHNFTYNELKAIVLLHTSISFTGAAGTSDVLASEGAQTIYNTGNYDFTHLNLTGYALNSSTLTVGMGNFTVNVSASGGPGQQLVNATAVNITDSDFLHGSGATETLYVYLDIPAGLPADSYTAPQAWVVDAN